MSYTDGDVKVSRETTVKSEIRTLTGGRAFLVRLTQVLESCFSLYIFVMSIVHICLAFTINGLFVTVFFCFSALGIVAGCWKIPFLVKFLI